MILQDPIWEQSFPDVSGIAVPFVDGGSGRVTSQRCRGKRRRSGVSRTRRGSGSLRRMFHSLDMDPVVVSSHEHRDVVFSFSAGPTTDC